MKQHTFIVILLIFSLILNAQLQTNACKCCSAQHSEFDFWIGTWEVTNADGSVAGENTIEKIQDNCILQENWTSATPGYTGTSNNFYNRKTKQWEQIWVDNQGTSLHMRGKRIGNQMIMRTDDETNTKGNVFFNRITWTANEDGTVRQLWETITNTTEITVAFDGLYKRKE